MGNIYLYTGNGAGKTTISLGQALRAMGHDKNVLMIQFLKWEKKTGEYLFSQFWQNIVANNDSNGITGNFEVYQFGREGWHGFNNLTTEDCIKAKEGLLFAHDLLNEKHYDLLILDEINLAVYLKLITIKELELFLDCIPKDLNIVMTGRHAPKELMNIADVVNEIKEIKTPITFINEEGIQY
jgi:cob(I)alamin adenosyltransferase